jgi:AcrR family transcriptional regulator
LLGTVEEVGKEVKSPGRRKYHSPLRADQALQTRARISDAAFRLFAEHGYAATTIAAVAAEADVSQETVYLSFGDKRGLLEGVIERAIVPEEDPGAQEAEWRRAIVELPTASERLARMVAYSCETLARTRQIHAVIRGAADKEPFASELRRRLLQERLSNQTARIRHSLRDDLRPGLSAKAAGERYCALASPELYSLLTVDLGWAPEEHRRWLTQLLEAELLDVTAAA